MVRTRCGGLQEVQQSRERCGVRQLSFAVSDPPPFAYLRGLWSGGRERGKGGIGAQLPAVAR
jgi:hypothetical protein